MATSGASTQYESATGVTTTTNGITVGPDHNLWFSAFEQPMIGRITTAGTATEFSTGAPGGTNIDSLTSGCDGNVWFNERVDTDALANVNPGTPSTSGVTTHTSGVPTGSGPGVVTPGPDGNIWFTNVGILAIGEIRTGCAAAAAAPAPTIVVPPTFTGERQVPGPRGGR